MRPISLTFGLVALVCVAAACGSSTTGDSKACVPNTTLVCDCLGGTQGVQFCIADGSGYSPCECSAPDGANGTDTVDDPDATEDSDTISQVCTEGATQEGTTTCGLNSEGVLMQDCTDGSWVDNTTCTGTDECKNGASQEGTTVCGFNDEGVLRQDCDDGAFVDSARCTGPDSLDRIQWHVKLDVTQSDEGDANVLATFSAVYFSEYFWEEANGVVYCTEHMEVTGKASFGPSVVPDCPNCTGLLTFDETSVVNVSDPITDPEHCTVAFLEVMAQIELATLLSKAEWGDFLSIALIDASTMDALGLDLSNSDSYVLSASEMTSQLADTGLEFTHAGYINNQPDSFAVLIGMDGVAANAGGDSPWIGYWQIHKDPGINPHTGSDMSGSYAGSAVWMLQMSQDD